MTRSTLFALVLCSLLPSLTGACAAGSTGSETLPLALVPSSATKADGAEGASTWEVYSDGASMIWVGVDARGLEQSRLTFRNAGDSVWLDVESTELAFATIGLSMAGEVISAPEDEQTFGTIAGMVDEVVRDSGAVITASGKEDGVEVPAACQAARELTVGRLLRLCVSSFGAYFRLFTGRGYDDGLAGIGQILADFITPQACAGGIGELLRGPSSLTRYCESPSRLEVTSASLTPSSSFSSIYDLTLELGVDRALPAALAEGEHVDVDVYDANGERVGFGFPREVAPGRFAARISVWDVVPGATYTVRASGDLTLSAETTVTAPE